MIAITTNNSTKVKPSLRLLERLGAGDKLAMIPSTDMVRTNKYNIGKTSCKKHALFGFINRDLLLLIINRSIIQFSPFN